MTFDGVVTPCFSRPTLRTCFFWHRACSNPTRQHPGRMRMSQSPSCRISAGIRFLSGRRNTITQTISNWSRCSLRMTGEIILSGAGTRSILDSPCAIQRGRLYRFPENGVAPAWNKPECTGSHYIKAASSRWMAVSRF